MSLFQPVTQARVICCSTAGTHEFPTRSMHAVVEISLPAQEK